MIVFSSSHRIQDIQLPRQRSPQFDVIEFGGPNAMHPY
jgi:hypothetical protein